MYLIVSILLSMDSIILSWITFCLCLSIDLQASRALQKLVEPGTSLEEYPATDLATSGVSDELAKVDSLGHLPLTDYSSLFGEEFKILDDRCDTSYLNVLDIASVEEGVLHVLYACVSQVSPSCSHMDILKGSCL